MATGSTATLATERKWHLIDADGKVLGRIATQASRLLQGKHKPTWAPFLDQGDHVVIVNAASVKLTGKKEDQKLYRYHSGYEGGLRELSHRYRRAGIRDGQDPWDSAADTGDYGQVSDAGALADRVPSTD